MLSCPEANWAGAWCFKISNAAGLFQHALKWGGGESFLRGVMMSMGARLHPGIPIVMGWLERFLL